MAATPDRQKVVGRVAMGVIVLSFVVTEGVSITLLLFVVGLAVLILPAIGPSGVMAPARAGGVDPLLAAAAVLATWWLSLPVSAAGAFLALGLAAAHVGTAIGTRWSAGRELAWHQVRVAQYPVLLLFGGLAIGAPARDPDAVVIALWAVLMVAYPVVLHRSQVRAVAPARTPAPTGRGWRIATALALVAVLLPVAAALVSALGSLGSSDPAYGDPSGNDGDASLGYWGFGSYLDTSTRGDLPDTEVLRVRADRPDYWRAGTYDAWDGRYWQPSAPVEGPTIPGAAGTGEPQYLPTSPSRGPAGSTVDLTQTFRVVAGTHELLYAAATPTVIETPGLEVTVRSDASLDTPYLLGPGTQWTVKSTRAAVTPADLRAIGVVVAPEPDDGVTRAYGPTRYATQIPDVVPDRVRELARDITAEATTTYDQVVAIEAWLADNIEYTKQPPVPADGEEAVDQTLFVDRVGSCDQIASAFVVLARAVGIPARLAVGFTAERFDSVRNEYVSLASNAHAWAEVWFGDAGWVGFDPTTDVPLAGEPSEDAALWKQLVPWAGLLAALGVIGLLAWWGAQRWVRWRAAIGDPQRRLRGLLRAFERALAERTRPRRRGETLVAYARAVTPPALHARSVALAEGLTDAAFGTRTTDLAGLDEALGSLAAAWERPRLGRRLWMRGWTAASPA